MPASLAEVVLSVLHAQVVIGVQGMQVAMLALTFCGESPLRIPFFCSLSAAADAQCLQH